MAFKRRCEVCRSKKWHKDPSSGTITCSEGHVLEGYRNETTEATEFGPHAMRKRTLKSGRAKREKQSKANPDLYHGKRAHYHYYQCLQVLLRLQIQALITLWQLSPEFETVCRDIWTLHLSLLRTPPSAEPYLHAQETLSGDKPSKIDDTKQSAGGEDDDDAKGNDDKNSSKGSSSDSEHASGKDEVMAELLREISEPATSDDDGEKLPTEGEASSKSKRRKSSRQGGVNDALAGNIAVLIVACLTLRVPIIYKDFIRLIEEYQLPYLDGFRRLPATLTRHLTKHTKHSLSPHFAPSVAFLHRVTSRFARSLHEVYGIFTPPLNAPPVLWRLVRRMGGNPVLFRISKTLAGLLDIPLTLHASLAPRPTQRTRRAPGMLKGDNEPPELSLAATVVICLKMAYGELAGKETGWTDGWDPASAMPALDSFLTHLRELETTKEEQRPFSVSPLSEAITCDSMDEEKMDAYIAFCERALLGGNGRVTGGQRNNGNDRIDEYFPIEYGRLRDPGYRVEGTSHKRPTLPAVEPRTDDGHDVKPAQTYAIYSGQDILGTLPEQLAAVIGSACRWAGVDEDEMCSMVERLERRAVRRWKMNTRKRRGGDDDGDGDDDDGDEEEDQ